jgi:dTDP-4-amino-4,6-dideoxygalactose transaminase
MSNTEDVEEFESKIAAYFEKDYCLTFSSFRIGLYHYLNSLNLKQGDEVLLSPITIPDTVNIILSLGLKPKFVDIDEETHCICFDSLKSQIGPNSKCLLITYLSGLVGLRRDIFEICKDNGILTIEDISQSFGSRSPNNEQPFFGDIQIGSMSSGKLISTYTGGFLITNDKNCYENIQKINISSAPPKSRFIYEILSNFKIVIASSKLVFPFVYFILFLYWKFHPKGPIFLTRKKLKKTVKDVFSNDAPVTREHIPNEWFTYLNSWQASVGLRYLSNIETRNAKRKKLAKILFDNLSTDVKKRIPKLALNNLNNNFYHLPIKTNIDKSFELKSLFMKGIDSEGYGLNLCSEEHIFQDINGDCPNAIKVKHQSIFIPLHESYSIDSIKEMASKLNNIYSNQERIY